LHKYYHITVKRLFNIIQTKAVQSPQTLFPGGSGNFRNPFSLRKKITVGIDIGLKNLRLVKIRRTSDQHKEMIDYLKIPFEADKPESKDNISFPSDHFLKSSLTDFCHNSEKAEIWSILSASDFQAHYIKIPKVPVGQIANAVYWTYKKEGDSFNEKDSIFDFQIIGNISEDGIKKIEIMAFTIPGKHVEELRNRFSEIGFPLTGIILYPFAFQNLFKSQWIKNEGGSVCNLYMGKKYSYIDIFFPNGQLALSRTIRTSIDSMIEAVNECGIENAEHNVLNIENDGIFDLIKPVVKRLSGQVERTLEHYTMNFKKNVDKIYFSCQIHICHQLLDYIYKHLEIPVEIIDPFHPQEHETDKVSSPESASERGAFAPAVGAAISDNIITPNLIFTYKEKDQLKKMFKINQLIIIILALLITVSAGIHYRQESVFKEKNSVIQQIEEQSGKYPLITEEIITQEIKKIKPEAEKLNVMGKKYLTAAIIREISERTPSDIRLLDLMIDLGGIKENKFVKMINIDGIILKNNDSFENIMTDYINALKESQLFAQPVIKNKSVEIFHGKDVLRFTLNMLIK